MQGFLVTLGICSITVSAIALLFITLSPLLAKRYSPKWQYYAWLIIILSLIIPFRLSFGFAFFNMDIPVAEPIIQYHEQAASEPAATIGIDPAPNMDNNLATNLNIYQILGLIWLLGILFTILYNLIRHHRSIRGINRWSEPVVGKEMLDILYDTTKSMAIFNTIQLRICPIIKSPMLIGLFKPTIILHTNDISADELALILRHELTHYKRKDLWYKILVLTATAIHWFNPIMYLISKEIALQCEISCDNEAVRDMDNQAKQQYSETIIGVIRQQSQLKTILSTSFYGGKKGMKKRIFSIMDTSNKKMGLIIILCVLILISGSGLGCTANIVLANNMELADNTAPPSEINTTTGVSNPNNTTVTTLSASEVTSTSGRMRGSFVNNTGSVECGFYWGTTSNPTMKEVVYTATDDSSDFSHNPMWLTPNTTYYYRAYAGSSTGEVQSFTTLPTVTNNVTAYTRNAVNIQNTSARLRGDFANNTGLIEYGFYWGTTNNPTTRIFVGTTDESYLDIVYELPGLMPDTKYYFRVYAGSSMGEVRSFTTPHWIPTM